MSERKEPKEEVGPQASHNLPTNPGMTVTGAEVGAPQSGPEPRLPHERDLSADSQSDPEQPVTDVGSQAHADLTHGLVDTDRGPVMDKLYDSRIKTDEGATGDPEAPARS